MLTMKAQSSLKNAESYFREHLGVGDYYMKGQSVSGQWFGDGAKELGLSGVTTEKEFLNLCNNLHPQTGEQLTPRMNTKRTTVDAKGHVHETANRRVFYDFTLSPPKTEALRQREAAAQAESRQQTESVKPVETPVETVKPTVQKSETTRRRLEIPPQQTQQKSKGMRV